MASISVNGANVSFAILSKQEFEVQSLADPDYKSQIIEWKGNDIDLKKPLVGTIHNLKRNFTYRYANET